MHPRLTELLDYVSLQRRLLHEAVSAVAECRRDLRPAPDDWSVAEVLEHLHRTESGVALLITARLAEARHAGLSEEREGGSVLGSLDRFGIAEGRRRVAAPRLIYPSGTLSWALGLERLAASREALRHAVSAGDGLALGGVTHPHPLLGSLNLYQWVLFVGQHEARHARQIGSAAGGS